MNPHPFNASRRRFLRQLSIGSLLGSELANGIGGIGLAASNAADAAGSPGKEPSGRRKTPEAAVRPVLGTPTVTVNEMPCGPMFYTPGGRDAWEREEVAKRGFRVTFEMVQNVGWLGAQEAAFQHLDTVMARVLKEAPEALVVLRIYVCNPPHFARDYPEEVMAFNDGSTQHFTRWFGMSQEPESERGYSSFASLVWREKTGEALRNYVDHVNRATYAPHVVGYFICGGGTEEWYYYENFDETKYCLDFSKPMKAAFRTYLREKYDANIDRLRAEWNDPAADFETALPPSPQERFQATDGVFWDPKRSQRVLDYFYVHNKVLEDAILYFCKTVKEACDQSKLVGVFYGALMNLWLVKGGQSTFKDLLRSPHVDFIASPPQYGRRGPGEHAALRFLNASVKQHGKIWLNESDIRTVLSKPDATNLMRNGRAMNLPDSLACLQREFAHLLCEGANGWWLQPESNDYHDEEILGLFARMQRIGRAAMGFDRSAETDIAAIVDQESLFAGPAFSFDHSHHLVAPSLLEGFRVQELCRIGAPVDYYELEDALSPSARHYKMYVLLNCFSLTADERQRLNALRRDGAILVWMYAPGIFHPGRNPELSVDYAKELLGFKLASETGERLSTNMQLTNRGVSYFPDFDPARIFGSFERPQWEANPKTGAVEQLKPGSTLLRQRFHGDGGGEVLARFVQGGRPAIVMREQEAATDVWIGSVMAPADLLRSFARRAGCHLFCDADEIVYANKSFLAIHTRTDGKRSFRLRRPGDVIELSSGRELARGSAQFEDEIPAFRTRLYFIGDKDKWRAAVAQG